LGIGHVPRRGTKDIGTPLANVQGCPGCARRQRTRIKKIHRVNGAVTNPGRNEGAAVAYIT
jgi:hypothetical protein